jgi:hypothetical protein
MSTSTDSHGEFFVPNVGPRQPGFHVQAPGAPHQHKESPMITKFISVLTTKNHDKSFSYLPEQIQAEIRDANEATSVYDIR